jgi:rfaE bifunctional protein nucleotidyltransferase chain/domain
MSEILASESLKTWAQKVHQQGMRLVLTNGCFDILHAGHVRYLKSARSLGDALFVAVNSDTSVRALKGAGRPINSQDDRAEIVGSLQCVDYVTIFDSLRVAQMIREVRPVIYVKGGDYTLEALDPEEVAALREVGTEIRILPQVPGRSTTGLISRLSPEPCTDK